MRKYLEIVTIKDDTVSKRFDISGKSKEQIEKILALKSKKLPKTKFIRIIDAPEELESTKIK